MPQQDNTYAEALDLFQQNLVVDEDGNTYNYTYIIDDQNDHVLPGDSGISEVYSPIGDAILTFPILTDGTYTKTLTLQDGKYLDITVEIGTVWPDHDHLARIDYTIIPYESDGTVATGGGTSGFFLTQNLNQGQLDAWENAGTASLYFGNAYRYSDYYNPDSGQMEPCYNDMSTGYIILPDYYKNHIGEVFPIYVDQPLTAAGQKVQFIKAGSCTCPAEWNLSDESGVATAFIDFFGGNVVSKDTPVPGEDTGASSQAEPEGGTDNIEKDTDNVTIDSLPSITVANLGLFSVYSLTSAQVKNIAQKLWSDDFYNNVIKNFYSPMDNIISFGVIPVNSGNLSGSTQSVYIGNYDTGITGKRLSDTFFTIDMGSVSVNEVYHGFADYEPYSQAWLYLPYIGTVELPLDDVARGGSIKVVYRCDAFSGACVAQIIATSPEAGSNLVQQHHGNILMYYPISGASYSSAYLGVIGGAAAIGLGAITQNPMAMAGGAAAVINSKPSYSRGGSVSSTAGWLGKQSPYIIKAVANTMEAKPLYKSLHGYVSNLDVRIGDVSGGFVKGTASYTNLSSIGAGKISDEELNEIQSLIGQGIYV